MRALLKALLVLAVLPVLAQPTLVFGCDATYPPMEFVDAGRRLVGFDLDLIQAVARAGGFQAVVKNTAWDGIFVGLAAGSYDAILSSVTITPERRARLDFSLPYANAGQVMVVAQGTRQRLRTLADLAGRTVGVQIGTTGGIAVARFKEVRLRTYDEEGMAIEDLALGRIDAVVIDAPTAANYVLRNERYRTRLKIAGAPFTDEYYGIAVRKGNRRVLDLINRGLEAALHDGTVDRLAALWLR